MSGDPNAGLTEGVTQEGVQYSVIGRGRSTILQLRLPPNIRVGAEPGAMVAFNGDVTLDKVKAGGIRKNLKLKMGGESGKLVWWESGSHGGELFLTSDRCIGAIQMDGTREWMVEKGGYLAHTGNLEVGSTSQGSLSAGLLGGEGFRVLTVKGTGTLFIEVPGHILGVAVPPGQSLSVDNGSLAAWPADQKYSVEKVCPSGMASWKSGEGLVCRFTGPAVAYIHGGGFPVTPQAVR